MDSQAFQKLGDAVIRGVVRWAVILLALVIVCIAQFGIILYLAFS